MHNSYFPLIFQQLRDGLSIRRPSESVISNKQNIQAFVWDGWCTRNFISFQSTTEGEVLAPTAPRPQTTTRDTNSEGLPQGFYFILTLSHILCGSFNDVVLSEKVGRCKWLPTAVCFSLIITNVLLRGSILDPEDHPLYPASCRISKWRNSLCYHLHGIVEIQPESLLLLINQDSCKPKLSRGDVGSFAGRMGRTCSFRRTYFLHRSQ